MPCVDDYPYEKAEPGTYKKLRRRIDMLARIACEIGDALQRADGFSYLSKEPRQWYWKHKKADAQRRKRTQKERERKLETRNSREKALAKLSKRERRLLGLNKGDIE